MTKDEIKKALDCCAKSYGDDVHCTDCPYDTLTPRACFERFCQDVLCKDALNLITEQEKSIQVAQDSILSLAQQNQEYREQQVKQAQLNVLGKLWARISHNKTLIQSHIADGSFTIEDIYMEIDELMAEVENGRAR